MTLKPALTRNTYIQSSKSCQLITKYKAPTSPIHPTPKAPFPLSAHDLSSRIPTAFHTCLPSFLPPLPLPSNCSKLSCRYQTHRIPASQITIFIHVPQDPIPGSHPPIVPPSPPTAQPRSPAPTPPSPNQPPTSPPLSTLQHTSQIPYLIHKPPTSSTKLSCAHPTSSPLAVSTPHQHFQQITFS